MKKQSKGNKCLLFLWLFSLISVSGFSQEKQSFAQKLGQLMELVTSQEVDTLKVESLLTTLVDPNGNPMEMAKMDYSIYPKFAGEKLYYIPYKQKSQDRFSIERLTNGKDVLYSIEFYLDSNYTLKDAKVSYKQEDYFYNCNLQQFQDLCTQAMTYSRGVANLEDTTVLSCVYINPKSKKRLMYWVVLQNPIGDKESNGIVQIKIQDARLWQK
ncbi:hypothetical protein ACYSNX_05605 [Myroides sp. LJL115]